MCGARLRLALMAGAPAHAPAPAAVAACLQVLAEGAPGVKPGGEVRRQEWCCGGQVGGVGAEGGGGTNQRQHCMSFHANGICLSM